MATSNPTLTNYGYSSINTLSSALTVTLPDSNVGAEKIVNLYQSTGENCTINTSQGSVYLSPGNMYYRRLIFTGNPAWISLTESPYNYITSFFPTTQKAGPLQGTSNSGNAAQGFSVAVSGDGNTLAIGGPLNSSVATNAGCSWIFVKTNGVWKQQARLQTATNAYQAEGYSVALSYNGNTFVAGGPGLTTATIAGSIYVYTRTGTTWSTGITLSSSSSNSSLGTSVAISSNGLVVAGGDIQFRTSNIGTVAIFTYNGTTWTGPTNINPSTTGEQRVGTSVALSNDGLTLAIGGPYYENTGVNVYAWVYYFSNGAWVQQATLDTPSSSAGRYGYRVALSGDGNTLAVGTAQDFSGSNVYGVYTTGGVYIYNRTNGSVWTLQTPTVILPTITSNAAFGLGLALSADGNTLCVGAPAYNSATSSVITGGVWTYTRNPTGSWLIGTQGYQNLLQGTIGTGLLAAYEGYSVALSADGSTLAVGGPGHVTGTIGNAGGASSTQVGQAWIFN